MDKKEQLLLEALRGYLSSQDAKLGLAAHDEEETSHTQWFQWEGIDDRFALKASDSPFFENLTSAFYTVHSYKYLDDPTFPIALEAELKSTGTPKAQIEQAVKYVSEIIEELQTGDAWGERDAGWNPAIDEITDMTRNADNRKAPTSEPFTGGGPAPAKNELEEYPK
jgi:hypothetical protein